MSFSATKTTKKGDIIHLPSCREFLNQHACPNSPLHFLPSKMRSPTFGATQQENMAANTRKYSCPLFWECNLCRFKTVVSKTVHVIFSCFLVVAKKKTWNENTMKMFRESEEKMDRLDNIYTESYTLQASKHIRAAEKCQKSTIRTNITHGKMECFGPQNMGERTLKM